jgi:hypothetical protein
MHHPTAAVPRGEHVGEALHLQAAVDARLTQRAQRVAAQLEFECKVASGPSHLSVKSTDPGAFNPGFIG